MIGDPLVSRCSAVGMRIVWIALLAARVASTVACVRAAADLGVSEGALVLTLVPTSAARPSPANRLDPALRYPPGSRIVRLIPEMGEAVELLSGDLQAAGAPDVSPDGTTVVFAGQAADSSAWGIYEVGYGSAPRTVHSGSRDCLDPAYLADGAVVFSCAAADPLDAGAAPVWSLFVARRGETEPERITFGVASAFDPTPLADGRILFAMQRSADAGESAGSDLFTINPDGSLLEAFGDGHGDSAFRYRPRQAADGAVVLLVARPDDPTSRILRIDAVRPAQMAPVSTSGAGPAATQAMPLSAEPLGDDLVTVQEETDGSALLRLSAGGGDVVAGAIDGMTVVEAIPIVTRPPPSGRPRNVSTSGTTGYVIDYDARRSDGIVGPPLGSPAPHAVRFQTVRAGRTPFLAAPSDVGGPANVAGAAADDLASAEVSPDGSFFFEVPADVPLRVATLDVAGEVIATSAWFWVRPGETRACFGCHEGHASAPVNRPIQAIARPPVELVTLLDELASRAVAEAPARRTP